MRHPLYQSFRIPATFVALGALSPEPFPSETVWELLGLFEGVDEWLRDPPPTIRKDPDELAIHNEPIEIVPFGWAGNDLLHYGWAVLAPELDRDDHPCVSFAPIDGRAWWLGDSTREALDNLLAQTVAGWARSPERQWGQPSPVDDPIWMPLCDVLDLHPSVGSLDVEEGEPLMRPFRPAVPAGWLHEETSDGIGVLADATAFAPFDFEFHPQAVDTNVDLARRLLDGGYPASALGVLKDTNTGRRGAAGQLMREAYHDLGRPLHVERMDAWLRSQTEPH